MTAASRPNHVGTQRLGVEPARGGLAGWQIRRLQDLAAGDLRGLTILKLAENVRLSPFHFTRAFTAAMGTTPGQWLIALRQERAKALLDGTELGVAEVAREVGYSGAPQLTRAFRTLTGLTPSEYRRR